MARLLIASQPIAGHVLPLLPVARELRARGHELRWYTGRKYVGRLQDAGAVWEPFVHARDYDDADFDASFPGRSGRRGLRQVLFDIREIFLGQIEGHLADLRAIHRAWPVDAVLADQTMVAALLGEERGGPPCALLGVLPLGIPSRDTAPFGLALGPGASRLGRWRNRGLAWAAHRSLFRAADRDLAALCQRVEVRPRLFAPPVAPSLMLQPTVPEFEYPRSDLPAQLHFIGPLFPEMEAVEAPDWWAEVTSSPRPVVLVTQGTLATDPRQLLLPALEALAGEDVLVVAAGVRDVRALGPLPSNVRTARFVPFAPLLPHVQVYVTNGGYGGVQQALSRGVPCLVAGNTEDKAEVGARVAYAGVGLNLRTARPRPERLRRAVRTLLEDGAYRERAAQLAAAMQAHDAPREAADWIERLLRERRD